MSDPLARYRVCAVAARRASPAGSSVATAAQRATSRVESRRVFCPAERSTGSRPGSFAAPIQLFEPRHWPAPLQTGRHPVSMSSPDAIELVQYGLILPRIAAYAWQSPVACPIAGHLSRPPPQNRPAPTPPPAYFPLSPGDRRVPLHWNV